MTVPVIKLSEYQLEKAHIDWASPRIQMVAGLLAVFCLCLVNLLSVGKFSLVDLAFYFGSCLLTALITLEITGRFGNRLGACCSIWSALLFCVFPWKVLWSESSYRIIEAISFLLLLAIFIWLRTGKSKIWPSLFLLLVLAPYLNDYYMGLHDFNQLLASSPHAHSVGFVNSDTILTAAYIFVGLTLLSRFVLKTLNYKALAVLAICTLIAIIPMDRSFFDRLWSLQDHLVYMSLIILAGSVSAMVTSFACLPVIDSGRITSNRVTAYLGLSALIMLTVTLQYLFTSFRY